MSADTPLGEVHLPVAYEPVYLATCDSALNAAVRRAEAGAPEGTLVWAGTQTRAQGRLGSRWMSPADGLYCAVVLRPDTPTTRLGEFVPLATVAAGTALAELVVPMTDLRFRWPNAVYLSGGRAAGNWVSAGSDWLVVATSINVASTSDADDFGHACISTEGGAPEVSVALTLETYLRHLTDWLACWDEEGLAPILRHLRIRAQQQGDETTLYLPGDTVVTGRFVAIDNTGDLQLDTVDGSRTLGLNAYMGLPPSA